MPVLQRLNWAFHKGEKDAKALSHVCVGIASFYGVWRDPDTRQQSLSEQPHHKLVSNFTANSIEFSKDETKNTRSKHEPGHRKSKADEPGLQDCAFPDNHFDLCAARDWPLGKERGKLRLPH